MTDRERAVSQLKHLIQTAHDENYDFVYIPVGNAKTIVRLLETQEIKLEKGGSIDGKSQPHESADRV